MAPVGPKGAPSTQRLRREQTQPVAFELDVPPEDIIADLIIANHLLFAISGSTLDFLPQRPLHTVGAYFLALDNFMFAAASMQMQFPRCAPPDPTRTLLDLICILLNGSCGIEC
ncbi:unnamed protein product [Miscanthus lutarioriparius]|uniref:Uncharacterized protein n=1 Tax=Miscanthus lutarioriparius TaxID=422564 RepID=A0A811RUV2_9POAL|nr:unnamed protein product [Miscanthus lutarioriparius]